MSIKPFKLNLLTVITLYSIFFLLTYNFCFIQQYVHALKEFHEKTFYLYFTIPLMLGCLLMIFFTVVLNYKTIKPLGIFLLLISASLSYSTYCFHTIFNESMFLNIWQTHYAEMTEYLSYGQIIWFFTLGMIPSYGLWRLNITQESFKRIALKKIICIACLFLISLGIGLSNFKEYAAIFRNHHGVHQLIYPFQWIHGIYQFFFHGPFFTGPKHQVTIGQDAYNSSNHKNGKFNFLVLVVGETARHNNLYYGGYYRNTNQHTTNDAIIYFNHATSCATYTAKSIPCMFSSRPSKLFSMKDSGYEDNILDILKRSAIRSQWIENNHGCKGVCQRIKTINIPTRQSLYCKHQTCVDEILLSYLKNIINKNMPHDQLIILHLIGSHGPNYHLRYPREHAYFKPECLIKDIQHCSSESLINTYDNTILYTDYIIHQIVTLLKSNSQFNTGLIYLSDHGESLGEHGLYLHGFPYSIAPKEQKEIPWMVWISSNLEQESSLDLKCLRDHAKNDRISHDHLFHSVLGLMNVTTKIYDSNLDIFYSCKRTAGVTSKKTSRETL
jgi:lipid A ethanolaminephosphotransferase